MRRPCCSTSAARALLNRPALAIVGSRHATPQGRTNAREFAQALAAAGLTIVSGLALGIDAAAHEARSTAEASTLAVIGTGPDRVYPARNRDLAHAIAQAGGAVVGIPARHAAAQGEFPAPQPADQRPRARRARRRGDAVVGIADHGALGGRAGPRGVRDSRLDPLAVLERLPQADSRRREARRNRAGRARRARPRLIARRRRRASNAAAAVARHREVLSSMGHDPVDDRRADRANRRRRPRRSPPGWSRLELDALVCALPGGYWQRR